jgi:hypothetical protein
VMGRKKMSLLCQLKMLLYRLMLPRAFCSRSFNILFISCVTIYGEMLF